MHPASIGARRVLRRRAYAEYPHPRVPRQSRIAQQRLQGGSRFNIRDRDRVPPVKSSDRMEDTLKVTIAVFRARISRYQPSSSRAC
jgi:hypothetical protein